MPPKSEVEESAQTLHEDVATLKEDLLRIKDDITVIADNLRLRLRDQAKTAQGSAQAHVRESMDSIEQHIVEKPLMMVLVAFGTGLLLGKVLSLK
ncbi:MAG: hypothetical protein HYV26_24350 [Candidatus Hydrogenedentes bacterium]|nr:hypothetical protein [Candidatus Hydrogenedentota bacterium]